MKKNEIKVHLGMPKCGSTSIQSFLSQSRSMLEPQGWFYPNIDILPADNQNYSWFEVKNLEIASGNAYKFLDMIRTDGDEISIDLLKQYKNLLSTQLDYFYKKNISLIFSCELLTHQDSTKLELLYDFLNLHYDRVTFIIFLREPVEWLISDYVQHVKQIMHCENFLRHAINRLHLLNYQNLIQNFLIATKGNLEVVVSDESVGSKDFLFEFLKICEINCDEKLFFSHENKSLTSLEIELLIASMEANEVESVEHIMAYLKSFPNIFKRLSKYKPLQSEVDLLHGALDDDYRAFIKYLNSIGK